MDKVDLKVKTAVSEVDGESLDNADSGKKIFITPEISAPIDVLEATTFFQSVSSGATN